MLEIKGKVNTAICYATVIEVEAIEQIRRICDYEFTAGSKVRIMPDVHAGKGCTIGTTMTVIDKAVPNVVGVDIGCGMYTVNLGNIEIDFEKLDEACHFVPSGMNVWQGRQEHFDLQQLRCFRELKDSKRLERSLGTLGGGNHFIELDKNEQGMYYLVVHTGSRNLGKQVAEIYQKLAVKCQSGWAEMVEEQNSLIAEYKQMGRKNELKEVIRNLHNSFKMRKPTIPAELSYLEGGFREDYLHDMRLCQRWAVINRKLIVDLLLDFLIEGGYADVTNESFESVHNYIGDDNIIRKGAISARKDEKCIIPMNMRDGSLICIGKGNEDWNFSAPHGAGRVMSRSQAFKLISMDDFEQSMNGIYSETITEVTKDESPMVYKPMDEIIDNIADTVDVVNIIKPIFNFKAAE